MVLSLDLLFDRAARLMERKAVHGFLVAFVVFAWFMFAPLLLLLFFAVADEPWLFLLGAGGLAGLLGASVRVLLGRRFFLLSPRARRRLVGCMVAGVAAAFAASAVLPIGIYGFTPIWLVGLAGLLVLAGSMAEPGTGSGGPSG